MTQRVTGQRFRQRKLSTKQNLPVVRESDVESLADDEAQRHVPKVETGVEKAEEIEHHLQAVISAAQASAVGGKVAQLYIPTPETVQSNVQYEQLYPKRFRQPATYIRFSSTVEDCNGCPYTMDTQDFGFLKAMNQKLGKAGICTEDDFEVVMNFFEESAASKQPFAAIDKPPVIPFEEMEAAYDETVDEGARRFAREIYEHWKSRRSASGNASITPGLKFETNLDTDDADPYVCFRRREVRQVRKTRGRDAQVTEKLKKMRKELEDARFLVHLVLQREQHRRQMLEKEKELYNIRKEFKRQKRLLGIKEPEDDVFLINQKPVQKPKPKIEPPMVRGVPGLGPKTPLPRPDGRLPESDMVHLSEKRAKNEAAIKANIEDNIAKHIAWNENYVDATWRPITPPLERSMNLTFRPAAVEFLPTPPTSEEGENGQQRPGTRSQTPNKPDPFVVKYETPMSPPLASRVAKPSFRRRVGRGGRLMIDRRGVKREAPEPVSSIPLSPNSVKFAENDKRLRTMERYRYDGDSEDEDDRCKMLDAYSDSHMKVRAQMEYQFRARAAEQAQQHMAALQRRLSAGQQAQPAG